MTPNTTDFQYKKKSLWYIFLSICQMSLLCKISYFGKRYHLLSICKKCTIMWSTTVWYSHKYFFEVSEKLHYFGTVFDLCKIDKSINKSFFVHFHTIGSWLHNSNLIGKKIVLGDDFFVKITFKNILPVANMSIKILSNCKSYL